MQLLVDFHETFIFGFPISEKIPFENIIGFMLNQYNNYFQHPNKNSLFLVCVLHDLPSLVSCGSCLMTLFTIILL